MFQFSEKHANFFVNVAVHILTRQGRRHILRYIDGADAQAAAKRLRIGAKLRGKVRFISLRPVGDA